MMKMKKMVKVLAAFCGLVLGAGAVGLFYVPVARGKKNPNRNFFAVRSGSQVGTHRLHIGKRPILQRVFCFILHQFADNPDQFILGKVLKFFPIHMVTLPVLTRHDSQSIANYNPLGAICQPSIL